MRIERWYWLPIFCVVSMAMHWTVAVIGSRAAVIERPPATASIEVSFDPVVSVPQPQPVPKPLPPKPKPRSSVARGPHRAVVTAYHIAAIHRVHKTEQQEPSVARPIVGVNPRPITEKPRPAVVELPDLFGAR